MMAMQNVKKEIQQVPKKRLNLKVLRISTLVGSQMV